MFPAYSTYVMHELKEIISDAEGYTEKIRKATPQAKKIIQMELDEKVNEVLQSGIIIHTALDPKKQERDEKAINALLSVPDLEASAAVIDNETREIVGMYAGKNYKKYDFHRAFQAPRQPGSSFKPIIVYAPLFETTDYTPSSLVNGGRICIGNFCPQNYGGAIYGNVSITDAFKHSMNTPAVRLFSKVGIERAFQYAQQFNFQSIVDQDKTYPAALGGLTYGVTTLEMADAYTSFIDGTYIKAHAIRKVTDRQGNVLYRWPTERKTIWSDKTVKHMRTLLSEVVKSGTGVGIRANSSYIGAKTGTTDNYRDFWLAGLSNEYTAAVWIGYDRPRSMQSLEKAKIHFKIFNQIISK
ncbi:transglycosylase domain-containing protein [Ureibacillus terrenus]|uniref:transglycosylase domain-containing protein n=1 Tax=Ureibacillus terrenus TaxID=118246 RepID=UPI001FE56E7E|nr:transglycosylase domain-containing protein [Ureibacillus terrenus]